MEALQELEKNQHLKIVDKLNGHFPVHLTISDIDQCPEFINLMVELSSCLTPDCISKHLQREYVQAEEAMQHEKHSWLLNHILHNELHELVMNLELQGQDMSLSSSDQQFQKVLQECLTLSEIGDYFDYSSDPTSKVALLGLTHEDLTRQNKYKKKLIPEIEERLMKKCENLVNFYESQANSDSSKLMFARSSQLPSLVEANIQKLEEEKKLLHDDTLKRDKQFWLYYQTLLDSLRLLETLISKYRLRNQPEYDAITSEWLIAKCDAMCLKIKLVELQVMCDTYTMETIQALATIRRHAEIAIKESEKEKTHRSRALNTYQSVGMGFDSIFEEFGRLKKELENKQWALQELEHTDEQKC
ncbi:hypothetical protein CHS0354_024695 [Potamilus streckersoni]|uniref:HAUS augmin-like complex subunit 4 n=1 Tax=Potamilus streckersoni TaxID=2493646 RepID=A0AAE0VLF0_9BIVA|nr:hypothetical protein CHS0354_024695 [Potamilus streckersoni]